MYKFMIIVLWLFSAISCADKKADLLTQIEAVQDEMEKQSFPSQENMQKIISLFSQYIEAYPNDEASYGYGELKAKYEAASGHYETAIETYKTLIATHPNDERNADNLFMQGFIYEENLKNTKEAEKTYKEFLSKYPNNPLAPSAQMSLDNLNLSDEELLQKIIKSNATTTNK